MLKEKTIGHKPCSPEVVGNESPQGYTTSKADNMLQRFPSLLKKLIQFLTCANIFYFMKSVYF